MIFLIFFDDKISKFDKIYHQNHKFLNSKIKVFFNLKLVLKKIKNKTFLKKKKKI